MTSHLHLLPLDETSSSPTLVTIAGRAQLRGHPEWLVVFPRIEGNGADTPVAAETDRATIGPLSFEIVFA